jgi:RNA polymerase sigma-70 factor, ECF subfamily
MNSLKKVSANWQEYQPAILNYLKKHSKDEMLSQDLAHDIFLKIHRLSLRSEYRVQNLRSWLFQLAHNALADHYRRPIEKCLCEENVGTLSLHPEQNPYLELADYVRPLLTCLPETYATPLALELDGLPQKDIARYLQLDLSTTKSRIQRSRKKMHGLFYECFHLELVASGRVENFEVRSDCQTLQRFLAEMRQSFSPNMHLFRA